MVSCFLISYAMPTRCATTLVPPARCSAVALPQGHLQLDTAWGQGQFLPCGTCVWWLLAVLACAPHVHPSVVGAAFSFVICLPDVSQLASCLKVCNLHTALPK